MDRVNGPRPPGEGLSPSGSGPLDSRGEPIGKPADRLPPPMFPPGSSRRHVRRQAVSGPDLEEVEQHSAIPEDAFISPDEPIHRKGALATSRARQRTDTRLEEGAFIDPDEPIVRTSPPRTPLDYEEVLGGWSSLDEVVVTGIGDDPHLSDEDLPTIETFEDPHVAELFGALDRLTEALRTKGQAGLKTTPDMTRFEATLRAYCVGYLAGRREEG